MEYEIPITIRFKEEIYKMIKNLSEEEERSINAEVNYIIKKYYDMKKGNL